MSTAVIRDKHKLLLFILIVAFLLLTSIVFLGYTQRTDEIITRELSEGSQGVIFESMTYLTYMGHYYFLLPATFIGIYLFYRLEGKYLSAFFGGMMFSLIPSYQVVKFALQRPRPDLNLFHSIGYSYPSGHTVGAFTFFIGFYVFYQLLHKEEHNIYFLITSCILANIVGISRMILGVHYFTDVIGGILLSGILIEIFFQGFKKMRSENRSTSNKSFTKEEQF